LLIEELREAKFPTNIVRVMKSRMMRWAGHLARVGSREIAWGFGGKI
jgi:hypothetical protein